MATTLCTCVLCDTRRCCLCPRVTGLNYLRLVHVDDPDNIFKKIIDGKIPCYKARTASAPVNGVQSAGTDSHVLALLVWVAQIFETEHALAFLDAFPMARGHSLLIPKATGYADLYDMPPDVAAAFLRELPRLAKAVKDATGCEGVNIVQNNGKAAGQVVMHAHFHVIPRMSGDGIVKLGAHGASANMIDPAMAQEVGDAIRAAL
jgi:hypothetical protein